MAVAPPQVLYDIWHVFYIKQILPIKLSGKILQLKFYHLNIIDQILLFFYFYNLAL